MTKIFTLAALFLSLQSVFAQCQTMTERDFQAAKQRMAMNSRTINAFQSAMDIGRMYCLSSSQARDIANYLANDRDKYDFLRSAFPNIIDKDNFTDVMDVFRLFSVAFKLYHQTLGGGMTLTPPPPLPTSSSVNCRVSMDGASYQMLQQTLRGLVDDRLKASAILKVKQQCMATQQIMNVVQTISDENIKLDVLKRIYPNVWDIDNYAQAATILNSNTARNHFIQFVQNPSSTSQNPTSEMTEVDFEQFLSTLKNQSFDKDREDYIKTYMKNAYINTVQIKKAIKLLSFDSSKLAIAKFLYDRCTDKQNYFNVSEELQFSSSKTELNDYVKSKM